MPVGRRAKLAPPPLSAPPPAARCGGVPAPAPSSLRAPRASGRIATGAPCDVWPTSLRRVQPPWRPSAGAREKRKPHAKTGVAELSATGGGGEGGEGGGGRGWCVRVVLWVVCVGVYMCWCVRVCFFVVRLTGCVIVLVINLSWFEQR